jgi:hypothetical protein
LYYIFQALCGGPLKITTVDGRKLMLQLKNVTTPNTETRITFLFCLSGEFLVDGLMIKKKNSTNI